MNLDVKKKVLNAFCALIRPIIRLALRNGVTYREFMDLCKNMYVDVAAEDYGVHGRDTNTSRIALITGLNRKDIKKIRDRMASGDSPEETHAPDRIARILTGWHQDPQFLDGKGMPLELPVEGEGPSFAELIRQYGGDIAVVTLVRELKRSKVIIETEQNRLKVLKRFYIPNPSSDLDTEPELINPKLIGHASSILTDHVTTIFHNLYRYDTGEPVRFERRATNHLVNKSVLPEFRQFTETLGQRFLEDVDDWLAAREQSVTTPESKRVRLGMGAYWIEGPDSNSEAID